MRIAVLTTVHLALDARIFYKQAVSLAQAGHDVTLFAPWDPRADAVARRNGIAYVPLRNTGRGRFERPLRWLQLIRLLRGFQAEVWHFHDPELLPLAILWKRLSARHVHLIYDIHEDVPKDVRNKRWIPARLRKPVSVLADWVEKWGMHQCLLVVAATDALARRAETSAQRVVTVHNYPLFSQQPPARRDNSSIHPVRVIHAGGLNEIRGIREMVQAMDELRDCNVELFLLGNLYPASFEQEIRRIAGDRVVIHDRVPFEQVTGYLRSSDIGIACSHPDDRTVESLPVKLFECMHAGLPVIASDFPLWRSIIDGAGCGILVDPTDPQQIAAAVCKLANDPELRRRMGEAGVRAVKEKYSWQREEETLIGAYNSITSDPDQG